MEQAIRVVEITHDQISHSPCCGIKDVEHEGHIHKTGWLRDYIDKGLKSRVLLTEDGRQTGFIEYLPGEYAWRGVIARNYMFIHCLWIHFKAYQHQGHAKHLVVCCEEDARESKMAGVAVVARQKPWLANSSIFLRLGYAVVETAPPDYELLVKKIDPMASDPRFTGAWEEKLKKYGEGLTIVRADQCPHTLRFTSSIAEEARSRYGLETRVEVLRDYRQAQAAPTPYAVFCIIYNGELLTDHQISKTRFRNLMDKRLGSGSLMSSGE